MRLTHAAMGGTKLPFPREAAKFIPVLGVIQMLAMLQNTTLAQSFLGSPLYWIVVVGGLLVVIVGLIIYKRRQA